MPTTRRRSPASACRRGKVEAQDVLREDGYALRIKLLAQPLCKFTVQLNGYHATGPRREHSGDCAAPRTDLHHACGPAIWPNAATIRCAAFASTRKFCPSLGLVGIFCSDGRRAGVAPLHDTHESWDTYRIGGSAVRTNIDIDDKLMKQAMKATGARTKKAAVEASLRKLLEVKARERALERAMRLQEDERQAADRKGRLREWRGQGIE